MVEINITVKADNDSKVLDLLTHIVREITEPEYRLAEINNNREVDLNWVHMDEGSYNWHRHDRS